MQLELTRKQFQELLKAVVIGVRIREAVGEERDARGWKKIGDIEAHLLSFAKDFNSEDMAEYFLDTWIPSDKLTEEMDEELEVYDNQEFWHRLHVDFAQRDFFRTITKEEEKFIKANNGMFPERMHQLYARYSAELEGHGVDRLEVAGEITGSKDSLSLRLTKMEYGVLKDVMVLDSGAEELVKNAEPSSGGLAMAGSWRDFDDLAGYVAAEANHCESRKKQNTLDRIYDKIEGLLR